MLGFCSYVDLSGLTFVVSPKAIPPYNPIEVILKVVIEPWATAIPMIRPATVPKRAQLYKCAKNRESSSAKVEGLKAVIKAVIVIMTMSLDKFFSPK